ncbi:hypothetical protein LX36DRAFT_42056 [Colletotrichum falcatum]|nr:hypothetical protein LX36DRAFT_42056 [Colletotrichum falcatum]
MGSGYLLKCGDVCYGIINIRQQRERMQQKHHHHHHHHHHLSLLREVGYPSVMQWRGGKVKLGRQRCLVGNIGRFREPRRYPKGWVDCDVDSTPRCCCWIPNAPKIHDPVLHQTARATRTSTPNPDLPPVRIGSAIILKPHLV